MKNNIHKADSLKAAFIDYVLANFDKSVIIGHEVMYGSREQFADLVILHNGYTYAVEIKSDSDSLYRIGNQLDAYRRLFNYVIVVCGKRYTNHLKESLPDGVGLFEIQEDNITKRIKRPRRETSNLDKQEMLLTIRASYLSKKADFPVSRMNACTLRAKYAKKRTSFIQEILYKYWYAKLRTPFCSFMTNRGEQTLPADLAYFSSFIVQPNV